ncbi:putative ribonuclease H-like domain-containing protein [Tanacetum coccineum]|uniref:Ribonuclease H-like domain-containing protein n=1 Tax=Tanacetum coccineum TaxID=301880 RepID=A0ABQ5BSH3_9ASTR
MTSTSADESQNLICKNLNTKCPTQNPVPTMSHNNNAIYLKLKKDEYETKNNVGRDPIGKQSIILPLSLAGYLVGCQSQMEVMKNPKIEESMLQAGNIQEFRVILKMMVLHKGYDRAFAFSWSQVAITLKAKGGLDYLNFDDLYNKLKSLEIDIKGGSSYKSNHSATLSHLAFVSTTSDFLHSFVAESDQQIIYEDFNQIGKLDLEELDIKWQMAMLSVRVNRFEKKARRKMNFNNRDAARECTGKQVESNARYSAFKIKELEQDKPADPKALLSVDSMVNWSDHEESADENASQVYGMIVGRDDEDEVAGEFALMGVTSQSMGWGNGDYNKEKDRNILSNLPTAHVPTPIPAGRQTGPAPVYAGTPVPAGRQNRPAPVHADRPFPAGRRNSVSVSAGWRNNAARPMEDGELLLSPQQVVLGETVDHICKGDPRTMENPLKNKDLGIVDSGCSRSMSGNKERLDDFVEIKGGTVTFGGGEGRITGKGTIRTSKLDFENVYYVKELQNFNLFSVSQICDKKNNVLFTETECLVLSKDFKLPDNSQVVLRVPRRHNLYSFNMNELQPEGTLTCLVAKASLDESTKWHRRMAHVNFKNINKLAKNGLVKGLPSKIFSNEHNCVACNKGKQHKASYKAITAVSTITEPLQLLHMDLFGPTSIRSIDHKYYCLVVTDDFSRFTEYYLCVSLVSQRLGQPTVTERHFARDVDLEGIKKKILMGETKINNLNLELEKVVKERDELKDKIAKWEELAKNLNEILNSQMSARDKTGLGYSTQLNELSSNHETDSENSLSIFDVRSSDEENTPENDRFSKNGYKTIPPPITWNLLTQRAGISFAGLDEYAIRNKIIESQIIMLKTKTSETAGQANTKKPKSASESVVSNPKINRDRVIIEDWNSDDEEEEYEVQTVRPETQTVKTRDDKSGQNSKKQGIGVLTRTGLHRPSVSTARPVCTARPSVSTARPICTARPSVSTARPVCTARPSVSTARPVCTAKPNVSTARPVYATRPIYPRMDNGNPEILLQDHAVVDSGCSSHMTGNKAYLSDYEDFNGGFVAFGSDPKGEAVNTACYVLNRVLVTKPQNKTPYELLIVKPLEYTTKGPKVVRRDLHNNFHKDLNQCRRTTGPNWMFDLDFLTNSMNYIPVSVENQVNMDAGTQDSYVAGSSGKDKGPPQEYILLPLQPHRTRIPIEDVAPDAHEKPSESSLKVNDVQDSEDAANKESEQAFEKENRRIASQKKATQATSTNKLSTDRPSFSTDRPSVSTDRPSISTDRPFVSTDRSNTPYVSAASTSTGANACESLFVYLGGKIPIDTSTLPNADLPIDPNMPDLEDASDTSSMDGIFNEAYDDDEDVVKWLISTTWITPLLIRFDRDEGLDYDEVFANLVARIEAIRLFLAFASYMGFTVYQMDVKSVFLYGTIEEEVYVHQPPGFVDPALLNKVYKVIKALYDLHQATRAWYETLSSFLIENGFRREFEECMHKIFQMSSMGELTFFLGLQVKQQPDRIFISQDKSMIGSLMYLTASRPDIIFAVVLCLWYPRDSPFELEAYSDSDYGGASLDRKSTTGGCQFLGRRLISWQCKKQTIVANSTTEAEYVATANCCGQNPVAHSRTKHIEIRFHFIRDCYEKRLIEVIKIHTDSNVADLLTKGFDVTRFNFLVILSMVMFSFSSLGSRESLERDMDGTEEFLLTNLFDFWLTKVSTDRLKVSTDRQSLYRYKAVSENTEGSGGNHGGQSSNDACLSGNKDGSSQEAKERSKPFSDTITKPGMKEQDWQGRLLYKKKGGTQGDTLDTLREIVEEARSKRPSDHSLDYACVYTKWEKHVTFADLLETSGNNITNHVKHPTVQKTNVPIIHSTRVSNATKAKRSQSKRNKMNDKTLQANSAHCPLTRNTKPKVVPVKQWKPTGRLIPLGGQCPLVRPTTLNRGTMHADPQGNNTPMEYNLVVQIFLWYLDLGCSKHMTGDRSWLRNFVKKFIKTVRFRNDHFGVIMGYGDYVIGDSVISKAPMFLWAAAIATACYTQNRSIIHTLHNKTPYELMHDKKLDLSFLRVFGMLCYATNNSEDLGKLKAKIDISSGLTPNLLTPGPISSGLVPNPTPVAPYMQEEIHDVDQIDIWELVPPPDCAMSIALKWIYKVKLDEYGDVLKVAKGYHQEEGLDFEESFAPVARLEAIRIIITPKIGRSGI